MLFKENKNIYQPDLSPMGVVDQDADIVSVQIHKVVAVEHHNSTTPCYARAVGGLENACKSQQDKTIMNID
jgi:hypothetical protein